MLLNILAMLVWATTTGAGATASGDDLPLGFSGQPRFQATETEPAYLLYAQGSRFDLDGDGTLEMVWHKYTGVFINDIELATGRTTGVAIVDIDKKDKSQEIAILTGIGENAKSVFYDYSGGSITKMGEIPSDIDNLRIDGSGYVRTRVKGDILADPLFAISHKLTEQHSLTQVPQRTLLELNYQVQSKIAVPLKKSRTGNSLIATLHPGESAVIVGIDNQKWCLVETANGTRGWLDIDDFNLVHAIGKRIGSTFSGICDESQDIDMNGDGVIDSVCFQKVDQGSINIHIGNLLLTEGGPGYQYRIVDIDPTDRMKEIVVGDDGPSDDYYSRFYFYDGKQIQSMGEIGGTPSYGLDLSTPGIVKGRERGRILHTWFYSQEYRLDPQHKLVPKATEFIRMDTPVTVKQELRLQKSPTDSTTAALLTPGQSAMITLTDNREWLRIDSANDVQGWIALDGYDTIRGTGKSAFEMFEGLSSAD